MELYFESERYDPPADLRPSLKNSRSATLRRGCAVKRLDHVNLLAAGVPAVREFAVERLGYRSTSASSSTTAPRPARG
jgi:catechol 2,3-dioxygenase